MVEEKIIDLYPSDLIQSPVHLSIGQEAAAVGVCACLNVDDWVFPTYRSHAIFLAKGGDIKSMFAELFGKLSGCSKGKAGSMHLTAPEVGIMGTSAVVSSTIPHAVGAAYASKLKGEKRIHVAIFGDGATEEGVYHESLNFAALHKLPVIFCCENNELAVHSKISERQAYKIQEQAALYGIAVTKVEQGLNFETISNAFRPLVRLTRRGDGPQFIEIVTCRYKEHVGIGEDFDGGYRGRNEIETWQALDPLIQDATNVERFRAEISAEIEDAVTFALESPQPAQDELETDIDRPDSRALYISKYDLPDRQPGVQSISYRKALMLSMSNAMSVRKETVVIGQGINDFKGFFGTTLDLNNEFESARSIDTPLAEEGMAGISVGLSLNGLYPIQHHIRSDFVLLASNQIINLIAKFRYMFGDLYRLPMLIRAVVGRSWGQGAQHSQSLQSLFAHIPGLTVIMPASSQSILETYPYVTQHYSGPVLSLEHRLMYELEFDVDWDSLGGLTMPLTSRKIREGSDVTVVASSIMVVEATRAAKYLLEHEDISCEIIDIHCISHPDQKMIVESVCRTGLLVVADTSWIPFGTASEICRIISETIPSALKKPVVSLGMAPVPCPTSKALEDLFYPNLANLVEAISRLVRGNDHKVSLPNEQSMSDYYKRFRGPF
jgi:TPP-dependent pyruvate/acetoin dehydrogenase alpha subunit/pyruvate/2-oxoglutarate/acetoin dehydrogenase E1 component